MTATICCTAWNVASFTPGHLSVLAQDVGHLRADGQDWIQCRHGLLKNHRDLITTQLGHVAQDTGAYIAGMAYEKIDEFPGRYFNTAFIVAPSGQTVLKYRKLYSLTGKTTPADAPSVSRTMHPRRCPTAAT